MINTIPFRADEWKNDGSDVCLLLRNKCARESCFADLQIERHVYLGNNLLSVNRELLQPKGFGDIYSFGLAQMYAYILLLEGKFPEQREYIAGLTESDNPFVKQRENLLNAMITENYIISGAPVEWIRARAEQHDFKSLLKDDPGIAYRLLYWLSSRGIAPADSAPEYYLEQHKRYLRNCGSQAAFELASNIMELIKKRCKAG